MAWRRVKMWKDGEAWHFTVSNSDKEYKVVDGVLYVKFEGSWRKIRYVGVNLDNYKSQRQRAVQVLLLLQ